MNDYNNPPEIKGPLGITNIEEYHKLQEEKLMNKSGSSNDGNKKLDPARSLRHPMAYVCDYIGATVSVVDIVDALKLMEIKVGDGALAIDISEANNNAYVTNFFGNTLSVINTINNKVVNTVMIGSNPAGVKVTKNGQFVYVVHFGEPFIYVLDAKKLDVITKIPLPSAGFQIDITKDDRLAFVSLPKLGAVAVVDLDVNLVVKVFNTGSGAEDVIISSVNPLAFISNQSSHNLTPVNTSLAEPATNNIETGNSPVGLAFGSGDRQLYVANRFDNNVSVIDVFSHNELIKIAVGIEPYGAASTSGGRLVLISNYLDNNLSIIDTRSNKVLSIAPTGVGPAFLAILERNRSPFCF